MRMGDKLPDLILSDTGELTDIDRRKRKFTVVGKPVVVQQSNYHKKVFVLEKVRFEHNRKTELRLGYYIIGKKPKMRGRWVWGQYCPLIPENDFRRLIRAARKKGWLD